MIIFICKTRYPFVVVFNIYECDYCLFMNKTLQNNSFPMKRRCGAEMSVLKPTTDQNSF
jgi:hypothetical protein